MDINVEKFLHPNHYFYTAYKVGHFLLLIITQKRTYQVFGRKIILPVALD